MKDIMIFYLKRLLRKSSTFYNSLNELEKSQYCSEIELEHLQNLKLEKLIYHCYKNVPFYTDLFKSLNLKPEDIKTKHDLKKLPFIDKFIVKDHFDKFIAKNKINMFSNTAYTSGTNGTPCKFLRDYNSINFENAAIWRQWKIAGDSGLKRITLRGDIVIPVSQVEAPFWKYNPADKELIMSSYHLSEKNAGIYINKILKFKPDILYALSSTANLLANYFEEHSINYTFKAIFTSSDSISSLQKEHTEKVFNSKIYDWYGQSERVVGIGQCEYGTYHINEDYSIVELIKSDLGYEPVGTNLVNYLMPLIRYKTGDNVFLSSERCLCGRHFRAVENFLGRKSGYILSPEGTKITLCNLIPRRVENIVESQFYQEKQGEVIINIVPTQNFNQADKELLIKNTIKHTSPYMKVEVRVVGHIPRGENGKFQSVINKLDKVQA